VAAQSQLPASPRLPRPPRSEPEGPTHTERHKLTRERTFPATMNLADLLTLLRRERVTGTLTIDLSSGGVNGIRLVESTVLTPE